MAIPHHQIYVFLGGWWGGDLPTLSDWMLEWPQFAFGFFLNGLIV